MEDKNVVTETEMDDQKIILNFLKNLKNEEQDLEGIDNFFDLAKIWETSSPFTDFRSKIDKKILILLPAILADLPIELELFLIEVDNIKKFITPDSEGEDLLLEKIRISIQAVEEKDWAALIVYHGKWSTFKKGREIIFSRIKSILEIKSVEELINFRSKNEYNKSIVGLIDEILSDNLPKILPRITSVSLLFSFLKEFYYDCDPKTLIEERLVEIFQNKFLFSVFSFDRLYGYWKLFSNKSKGQAILKEAITKDIEGVTNLSILFQKMNIVDKIDTSIRKLFYEKIINLIQDLTPEDSNYEFFLKVLLDDTEKRNLPEELIPVLKQKAEEILLKS